MPLMLVLCFAIGACEADPAGQLTATETTPETSTAASPPDVTTSRASGAGQAEMRKGLATFRRATARYHRVEAATADGFEQILPCLSNPDGPGAIGIPFAKLDRFDAEIDLSKPEILFYEPQADGSLRLVGGEPAVPIAAWEATGQTEPPSLFGREFHRNEEHGLYGLHMWVWRDSPDGVFSFWNANVSCDFAE
ncbi:MAG: hypothetical protein ACOC83_00315 [Gemmatimonadota bacterium]